VKFTSLWRHLTEAFGDKVIPQDLKTRIHEYDPIGAKEIPNSAYFDSDHLSDSMLDSLWDELKRIFFEARHCDMYGKDENAWCLDVVQPILSSQFHGANQLQLLSVQSQQINASLLPMMRNNPSRINKKTDYAFSFSCYAKGCSVFLRSLACHI